MQEEYNLSHLKELEAESIHIIREVAAEFENPVMLYSIGKDSSVMVRLAEKAFAPGKVPFPLMHIDSKWKFKEMIQFRDEYAKKYGWNLIVESNMEAFKAGVGPFTHGSKVHTDLMKTQALLHALDKYKFDAAFGGARRDEEKSRAKERIFSFRNEFHQWDPKNQRPELWDIYNARIRKGESIRVFPLSNWTELDIWQYIRLENIPIVPLYFAKERPVVNMDGQLIMPDDDRLPEKYRDKIEMKKIRFRTLGCWPLTGAIESEADTSEKIVEEMMTTTKSDRTGETEIWLQSIEGGDPIQLTQNNDTYIRQLMWSPDSKKILYTDRKNRIVEVDIASKAKRTVMQNPEGEFYEVNYSPDSQWITYTKSGANNMSVIYVYHLTSGKEYPVTEKWYNSSSPVFSTDGKYLIFSSERDFNPIYSQTEWNHAYNRMGGVYMAMLANDTPSPLLPSDEMVSIEQQATDAVNKKTEATNNAVKIDPEGLPGRLIKLPLQAGNYDNFYSDGKKVWYASGRSTKVYDLTEQKEETVAEGAYMDVAANHRKALFFKGNNLYICDFPCTKASLEENVNLDDMIAPIDYSQEWAQIFDETWRAFRDGFYLENMHGADWNAIKEKYAVLVPHAKTRLDLNYIIGEMIAELACGHAYVSPGEIKGPERIPMGLLGAELSRDKGGFYRIDKILPGAIYSQKLRSPLTEPGIGVKEGDYITAIDGISTATVDNIYSLLAGKANVLTELSINRTASSKGARKVVIKPLDNEYPLYHYNWVQNNIKKVEEATNGRVGYVYIPDMGPDGLNEFARYFYPQLDKEALIIDDRANGGGNVSPMIIERLLREPYRLTMRRGSTKIGTIPDATLVGPKVLLINKYSASDGDLFPWSFKANKIGKVIGTRTWGGIVGISGPLPYMDGTDVRVPFFTNYDAKTGQWIVENHGVDPDILIDNDPVKEQSGEDQQLNKAIEVILQELKDRKPLPSVPAPRTYKDLGVE